MCPLFARSPSVSVIPQFFQVIANSIVQLPGFHDLPTQFGRKSLHLFIKRLAFVLLLLGAHVAAGRNHMAVHANLVERSALTETGDVFVLARALLATPSVEGAGNLANLGSA